MTSQHHSELFFMMSECFYDIIMISKHQTRTGMVQRLYLLLDADRYWLMQMDACMSMPQCVYGMKHAVHIVYHWNCVYYIHMCKKVMLYAQRIEQF